MIFLNCAIKHKSSHFPKKSIHQTTNQLIIWSSKWLIMQKTKTRLHSKINQSISLYIKQLINTSLLEIINQSNPSNNPFIESTNCPMSNQPTTNPTTQPPNQPADRPTDRPTDQPTNQPTNQPTYQAFLPNFLLWELCLSILLWGDQGPCIPGGGSTFKIKYNCIMVYGTKLKKNIFVYRYK